MSINYSDGNIENNKLDNFLGKAKITDDIIKKINDILSINNIDKIFLILEKYIENGRNIYAKYGTTIEKKEKIIDLILNNISRLLNDLNVKRVHNSSSCIMINDLEKLEYREQLEKILFIKHVSLSKQNLVGGSCNNWVVFFHKLMNDITAGDEEIKYNFQINTKTNHGIIYLNIGGKKYIFEDSPRGFILELREKGDFKVKEKNKPEFFESVEEYKEEILEGVKNRKDLTYHIGNNRLKLKIRFGLLIISYKNKQSKYIKINGLKRISKGISEIGITKYVWKKPKFDNLENIKEFIIGKIKDKDMVKEIVEHFNDEKLLSFFK